VVIKAVDPNDYTEFGQWPVDGRRNHGDLNVVTSNISRNFDPRDTWEKISEVLRGMLRHHQYATHSGSSIRAVYGTYPVRSAIPPCEEKLLRNEKLGVCHAYPSS